MGCTTAKPQTVQSQKKEMLQKQKIELVDPSIEKDIENIQTKQINDRDKIPANEQFQDHHVRNQHSSNKSLSKIQISKRRIIEHVKLAIIQNKYFKEQIQHYQYLMQAYMQRLFIDILQDTKSKYDQNVIVTIEEVIKQVSLKYFTEMYQVKEFIDAGIGQILIPESYQLNHNVQLFGDILLSSDLCIYPVLKSLKQKYQFALDKNCIVNLESFDKFQNVLQNFPSSSFMDPMYLNTSTLIYDLSILINKAFKLFPEIKTGISTLLTCEVDCHLKIPTVETNGVTTYQLVAVRKLIIEILQSIVERMGNDQRVIETYMPLIRQKMLLMDKFHLNQSADQNLYKIIILQVLMIIENLKYDPQFLDPNPKYGIYIYDFMKCKVMCKTTKDVLTFVNILKNNTKIGGKSYQIIRLRNNTKTINQNVIVNLKIDQILYAEITFMLETIDYKIVQSNKFYRFLQSLENGILGPTIQLMMNYQDLFYKSEVVQYMTGPIPIRQKLFHVQASNKKCINNHILYKTTGNHFPRIVENQKFYTCRYCFKLFAFETQYLFCYKCNWMVCSQCKIQQIDLKSIKLIIDHIKVIAEHTKIVQIKQQLRFNKSALVFFYDLDSIPNLMMKDFLSYFGTIQYESNRKKYQKILFMNKDDPDVKLIVQEYGIKEYPSLCLIDKELKIRKILIGFSVSNLAQMFELKEKLVQGNQELKIDLLCVKHKKKLQVIQIKEPSKLCFICQKPVQFSCKYYQHHFRDRIDNTQSVLSCDLCDNVICKPCGAFAFPDIKYHQDRLGIEYLQISYRNEYLHQDLGMCSNKKQPHKIKIEQNHKFKHNHFECCKCTKIFSVIKTNGLAICEKCPGYVVCYDCLEYKIVKQKSKVNHFAESTLSSGKKCFSCQSFFKLTYQSREKHRKHFKLEVYEQYGWKCYFCQKLFQKKSDKEFIRHIACFKCNIQICMPCAQKQLLTVPQVYPKALVNQQLPIICAKNHKIHRTNLIKKLPWFNCQQCRDHFHSTTNHYECLKCVTQWCFPCGIRLLRLFITKVNCEKGHSLTKVQNKGQFLYGFFCRNCLKKVQRQSKNPYSKCLTCEDYNICYECSCQLLSQPLAKEELKKCSKKHFMSKRYDKVSEICAKCKKSTIQTPYWACEVCTEKQCLECKK